MKSTKKLFLSLAVSGVMLAGNLVWAQGCVAAHSNQRVLDELIASTPESTPSPLSIHNLTVNIGYRVFNSNKYFQGTNEIARPTAVENHQNIFDIGLEYRLNKRWSLLADVPVYNGTRDQIYPPSGIFQVSGLGDITIGAQSWLFRPPTENGGNVAVSAAVKLPTGIDDATGSGLYHGQIIKATADQSMQPGDGSWGFNVGTQAYTSQAAVALAEQYPEGVYAAIGLHPIHTARSYHDEAELGGGEAAKAFTSRGETFDMDYYRPLALHEKTVAIGECGLDYFRFDENEGRDIQMKRQREAFMAQIMLAREVKKPLMIHCRNAFGDLIEILSSPGYQKIDNPGIIHFFTGTPDDARKLLDLGFSFTFGGVVTFPPRKGKSQGDYDEAIALIPENAARVAALVGEHRKAASPRTANTRLDALEQHCNRLLEEFEELSGAWRDSGDRMMLGSVLARTRSALERLSLELGA